MVFFLNFYADVMQSTHPLIRTSQVSLSSNPDADFRYSTIFTPIGLYKGQLFAIKKVRKKNIDITREMKMELKLVSTEFLIYNAYYYLTYFIVYSMQDISQVIVLSTFVSVSLHLFLYFNYIEVESYVTL